jgi:hypothetical protein
MYNTSYNMNEDITEDLFAKHITTEDLCMFKWRILKYMCDVSGIYETFPETLLFHRTALKSAIDDKFSQKSSHHKEKTIYKLVMDNVMNCLMKRDAIEIVSEYEYGDFKMILYGKKKLKDLCDEFKKYETGDLELLDKLLPKRV